MLPLLAALTIIVTPVGVPSAVRVECEKHAAIIEQVKLMQVRGKTIEEVAFELDLAGYEELIQDAFRLLVTPAELKKRAYATCLRVYEK